MAGVLWIVLAQLLTICSAQELPPNLALGATYTLSPPPNYAYCTDPDDLTQLTDGMYTQGYFWTQPSTVGWSGGGLKHIRLDLGRVYPICGVAYNTAAGVAEVHWPRHVLIFVSDDGEAWYQVGDLINLVGPNSLPAYGTYAVRKLETHDLQTHGRYVHLAIEAGGPYVFVDEVEVYPGAPEFLSVALPGEPISEVEQYFTLVAFTDRIKEQLRRDLASLQEDLTGPGLTDAQRARLSAEADRLAAQVEKMPLAMPEGFRAVLPMNELEKTIFALQAAVWREEGKPLLRVWHCHRWDYLGPADEPAADAPPPALAVRMMNGEVRADVLNFTNAAGTETTIRLQIRGLGETLNPAWITVRRVLHVGTRHFKSVAAAMPEAERQGDEFLIPLPPGMTIQVWFELRPVDLQPGRHQGSIVVSSDAGELARVPFTLTISPLRFPPETSLLVGGWDYTDGGGAYGVKPTNRLQFIEYLQDMGVNMPWATSGAMPTGTFDETGVLLEPPDTSRFDEWVRLWPNAKLYMVFLARGDNFAGAKIGTEEFARRVGNWAHFWARHMRDLGLQPSQLGFLVYDEPNDPRGYRINEEWAKAIQAAEPDFVLFVDPTGSRPEGMDAMNAQMDVLCPMRTMFLRLDWMPGYFAQQRQQGRELWFYSCNGPARSFDPFAYYLLQAWHAFAVGGRGSCFWAFGDDNRADVWNEYVGDGPGPYCPMYLDAQGVTTGKWFEAIRESAEDFEYLVMLRNRLDDPRLREQAPEEVARAKELLEAGPQEVLQQAPNNCAQWDEPKDRAVADRVRERVLDALERLAG